jgi:cyclic 2,3-diphosphoglycerate synthase
MSLGGLLGGGSRRAIAIIDGEHYGPVVAETLAALADEVVAAVLVGGTEKLRGGEDYGVPLSASLEKAIARYDPEVVIDLSDEPVLGPAERFALASRVLALGVAYEGADFRFVPPALAVVEQPTLAVIGTGKRVGKTAVTGHLARQLSGNRRLVVVAMGRGGPAEPELVSVAPTLEGLLALSRAGRHACSDHLETALVAGVATIGCRRCGGGLAGAVMASNVLAGVELAATLSPDLILLDGSGAAMPPIAAGSTVLVVGGHQQPELVAGYLNAYRALRADLVVVTMAEGDGSRSVAEAVAAVARPGTDVIRTVLRPRPLESIHGERVAWFGTAPLTHAPLLAAHLEDAHGATVSHVSSALADREALRRELDEVDAETFVIELKAAAVDVVAEEAARRGVRVVVAANDVIPLPGEPDLDEACERLARQATNRVAMRVA